MKKKTKIYLDTSVISYLDQQDVPVLMQQTRELWEVFKTGKYEIVVSDMTRFELENCKPQKRAILSGYLDMIFGIHYVEAENVDEVVHEIVKEEVLSMSHYEDCYHIATAILTGCDVILSWNFRHLVRPKTIDGVKRLLLKKYPGKRIDICAPDTFLNREDEVL
jgi:predicted nucleic acid-binding protein